jgi:hypothetical protein
VKIAGSNPAGGTALWTNRVSREHRQHAGTMVACSVNRGDVAIRRIDMGAARGRFDTVELKGVFGWV